MAFTINLIDGPVLTWNLLMPIMQPLKGARGTELVGLSDGFVRWLLAEPQSQSPAAALCRPGGEILIVTDTGRVIKSVWKVSQKTEKLKRD